MEQQLRAGITPTLPTSANERADLLASSLLPNGSGDGAAPAASADPSSKPSPHVSSFVVPIAPTLTKKRARPLGRDIGVLAGDSRRRSRGLRALGGGAAAGGDSSLPFFVVKEWPFVKTKRGAAAIKKPVFFWELWMMMAAFGEDRKTEQGGSDGGGVQGERG